MNVYIDADAFSRWEKGEFDLPGWLETNDVTGAFPSIAWQQIVFGALAWEPARAAKRSRFLLLAGGMPVAPFGRAHAVRAAQIAAEMKLNTIGLSDTQIAATALVDGAALLTFNVDHFRRVPGLRLAAPS